MYLVKYVGLGLVALWAVLTGAAMAARLNQRVKALTSALVFLDTIAGELRYSLAPPDEIIAHLLEREDCEHAPYLLYCHTLCKKGMAFPHAWQKALKENAGSLSREDGQTIADLSQVLGRCALDETLTAIQRTQNLLETALVSARDDARERGKLYRTLGMLSGAFLIILWI